MKEQRFPRGWWNEKRVKQLIDELDSRSEEEWLAAVQRPAPPHPEETEN